MKIEDKIREDWGISPIGTACLRVWQMLNQSARLDHFTYQQLAACAGDANAALPEALLYLSAPSVQVLRLSLLYEHDGNLFAIPDVEQVHFANGEPVVHPYTGEQLSSSQLLMSFEPGARLKEGAS